MHKLKLRYFLKGDASTQQCSDNYAGPKPFSEPETLALSKFIDSVDNILVYLSFHSY